MARIVVVYWQDIPSMIEARDGVEVHKMQLSPRFQELIDMVAMRKKLVGTDQYLEQWRRAKLDERAGQVKDVAAVVADEFEARFEEIKANAIAQMTTQ